MYSVPLEPPSLLLAVDRIKLLGAVRKFEPDYIDVGEKVEAEHKEAMEHLTAQLGAVMENVRRPIALPCQTD